MKSTTPILLFFLFFSLPLSAKEAPQPQTADLHQIIHQIETRRGLWIALQADVNLDFLTEGTYRASCHGKLLYQKLDEKMLLQCFDTQNEPVFTFKTSDKFFELYLPGHKSLFRGNVFDLEDSPEIQSHLRALDLYRALKPIAIPEREARIENQEDGLTYLKIDRKQKGETILFRELVVNPNGDVEKEIYYNLKGEPNALIRRGKFQSFSEGTEKKRTSEFPLRVDIVYDKEMLGKKKSAETRILFQKIEFLPELAESIFEVHVPDGTHLITLDDTANKEGA